PDSAFRKAVAMAQQELESKGPVSQGFQQLLYCDSREALKDAVLGLPLKEKGELMARFYMVVSLPQPITETIRDILDGFVHNRKPDSATLPKMNFRKEADLIGNEECIFREALNKICT
ncbi:MAG: hypothetical protein HYZ48_02125, partial [Chlamydiales bacterium]|nr:hypothetical protein [Chlamydiales bacterium]